MQVAGEPPPPDPLVLANCAHFPELCGRFTVFHRCRSLNPTGAAAGVRKIEKPRWKFLFLQTHYICRTGKLYVNLKLLIINAAPSCWLFCHFCVVLDGEERNSTNMADKFLTPRVRTVTYWPLSWFLSCGLFPRTPRAGTAHMAPVTLYNFCLLLHSIVCW